MARWRLKSPTSWLFLLNRLCRRGSKKKSMLRVTGLCAGNSPVTGEFPAQIASNAKYVSIWWCHHVMFLYNCSPKCPCNWMGVGHFITGMLGLITLLLVSHYLVENCSSLINSILGRRVKHFIQLILATLVDFLSPGPILQTEINKTKIQC